MTAIQNDRHGSIQTWVRIAGVLLLLTIVAGGFGEFYVPSRLIVSADAAATAKNIRDSGWLFRVGFASYLVEAVCDIALALIFYILLRPVRKDLALLAAFFGLVSTALFAVAELFYFAASIILGGAGYLKTFSPDQLNTLALLSLKLYGYGLCHAEFRAGPGPGICIRRPSSADVRRGNLNDRLVPGEGSRRREVGSESGPVTVFTSDPVRPGE